jgi:4-amino-4-deoxy-L-arabinose transferase-like glycosyltransferase
VGAVVGVGLEAKDTVLLLLAGLAIGLAVNRQARLFRSGWLWAGAGVAIALWAPNLVWQAANGWPSDPRSLLLPVRYLSRRHRCGDATTITTRAR